MSRGLDQLDGHLLRVLCTVLEEGSVSRAAVKLKQTQPAVSAALKRLRELLGDPLLVRERGGLVPTARAVGLAPQARAALDAMARLFAEPLSFDPAEAAQTFRIASPDYIAASFLGGLARRLRAEAPGCRLEVRPLGADFDYERALGDDELDVVIGNWPSPPEHLHLSLVFEDELVCVVAAGHPWLHDTGPDGPTEAQYLAAGHVVPTAYAIAQRGVVETHLAAHGARRDARVVVPYFALAPQIAAETDLVFTTARHFAEHHARVLPLTVLPAPAGFPRMRFYQLWHDRRHHAPAHRWLRRQVAAAGQALVAGPAPV